MLIAFWIDSKESIYLELTSHPFDTHARTNNHFKHLISMWDIQHFNILWNSMELHSSWAHFGCIHLLLFGWNAYLQVIIYHWNGNVYWNQGKKGRVLCQFHCSGRCMHNVNTLMYAFKWALFEIVIWIYGRWFLTTVR